MEEVRVVPFHEALPPEVLVHIFSFFQSTSGTERQGLGHCRLVCSEWNAFLMEAMTEIKERMAIQRGYFKVAVVGEENCFIFKPPNLKFLLHHSNPAASSEFLFHDTNTPNQICCFSPLHSTHNTHNTNEGCVCDMRTGTSIPKVKVRVLWWEREDVVVVCTKACIELFAHDGTSVAVIRMDGEDLLDALIANNSLLFVVKASKISLYKVVSLKDLTPKLVTMHPYPLSVTPLLSCFRGKVLVYGAYEFFGFVSDLETGEIATQLNFKSQRRRILVQTYNNQVVAFFKANQIQDNSYGIQVFTSEGEDGRYADKVFELPGNLERVVRWKGLLVLLCHLKKDSRSPCESTCLLFMDHTFNMLHCSYTISGEFLFDESDTHNTDHLPLIGEEGNRVVYLRCVVNKNK